VFFLLHLSFLYESLPITHTRISIIVYVRSQLSVVHFDDENLVNLTKAFTWVTWTFACGPCPFVFGTVGVWIVFIPDIMEEVNVISSREQCCCNWMHGCITPSLFLTIFSINFKVEWRKDWLRSRNHPSLPDIQRTSCKPHRAKNPCLQSRNYSRLAKRSKHKGMLGKGVRAGYWQWHRL